jgi:shikimate dehydrogenase
VRYAGVISGEGRKSLSPVFQQAAIDALGLDLVYEAWPTAEDGLATRVSTLRAPTVVGANVTIPHKEAIIPMLDSVDDLAATVGAVNTVVNEESVLSGQNTDVEGFLRALKEDGAMDPAGKRALISGAGGAARAVTVALIDSGAAAITLINRTFPRASRLVEGLSEHAGDTELSALPDLYASWLTSSARCDLLVNCTPAGSSSGAESDDSEIPFDILRSGMLVYDLVYLPSETPLMAAARARGATVLGGLPMLIYQGAASFRIWTGRDAPVDVMFSAARQALEAAEAGEA